MPKGRKAAKDPAQRLARLRRRNDLVIMGGKRPLGIYIREGQETIQPEIAIWADTQSGVILASEVLNPKASADGGVSEALEALVKALTHPAPLAPPPANWSLADALTQRATSQPIPFPRAPQPGLPTRLLVSDAALAQVAQAVFAPLDVPVEYQPDLPALDQLFQSLAQHMGAKEDAGPPEPFSWDIPAEALSPLYAAAAGYWRRAPWEYLPDHPPVVIELGEQGPQPDVPRLYVSILGAGDQVYGAAFYYSLDALDRALQHGEELITDNPKIDAAIEMLRQAGAPIDQIAPADLRVVVGNLLVEEEGLTDNQVWELMEDGLVCFFNTKEECDPTYLEWMKARKLKAASQDGIPYFLKTNAGQETRPPVQREARALTLAFEALNQFFSQFRAQLEAGAPLGVPLTLTVRVNLGPDRITVPVSFTPTEEMYLDDLLFAEEYDEPEEPASEAALTTVYRFQVRLQWMKDVWRRIELTGDQTLHDLHLAIQEAFDWDNDHLYAFFLSGKAWDQATAYESPYGEAERSAAEYRLEHLPLKKGQRLLYIFDFGDDLRHDVKLEAILPGAAQPGATYPRITEQHGKAPPQYPNAEEEEEAGEEEDEDGED